jgi:ABC-2 type transport system permease protein
VSHLASTAVRTNVGKGLSFGRIAKGEFIKFTTLRSTWITYAVALIIAVGIGTLVTWLHGREAFRHTESEPWDAVIFTQAGVFFGQLAIGVIGVLTVTGEYATGMIRATMSAVPKRTPALLAKVVVFALVTAVVSALMSFGAYFLGNLVVEQYGFNGSITDPGAIRALLGATFYLTVIGLIGVGLGFAIRNTGGAIAALVGAILVLPLIISMLPHNLNEHITKFLPMDMLARLLTTVPQKAPAPMPMWQNFLWLAVYALVAIVLGWFVLKKRDV